MEMDLRIVVRSDSGVSVIELNGELDAYTCSRLRDTMIEVIEDGSPTLVVSLANVEYIDSSGLGVLVGGLKRATENNGKISIVCTNPQIRKVFEITGLVRVFPIYETEKDAVQESRA